MSTVSIDLKLTRGVSVQPKLYGMHDGKGNNYFSAECQACFIMNSAWTSEHAALHHFVHCSRKHSYVLEEDYPIAVTPHDVFLQNTIVAAMEYSLPLPGFETHRNCIMQMRGSVAVCLLHDMKGTYAIKGRVHWLGYL